MGEGDPSYNIVTSSAGHLDLPSYVGGLREWHEEEGGRTSNSQVLPCSSLSREHIHHGDKGEGKRMVLFWEVEELEEQVSCLKRTRSLLAGEYPNMISAIHWFWWLHWLYIHFPTDFGDLFVNLESTFQCLFFLIAFLVYLPLIIHETKLSLTTFWFAHLCYVLGYCLLFLFL